MTAPAIIRCSCSTNLAVWNAAPCARVHTADGWEAVLKPVVARYQGKVLRIYFRADAGFANPEVYEYLEAEGSNMQSVCQPIASCRSGSAICSTALLVARPMTCADPMQVSPIRLGAGRYRAG
jgi:hypothetical protein